MNAEIISVGTELLLGDIANTDAQYISQCLAELGINVFFHTVVGDNRKRMEDVLHIAKTRSDLIITTGGLGPTYDDITKETLAFAFGLELVLHTPSMKRLEDFFEARGRKMTENNLKQAYMPDGCDVLQNDWGTAPACAFDKDGVKVVMLPGPPRECFPCMRERAMPWLSVFSSLTLVSRNVRIFGAGESAVEARIEHLMTSSLNPTVAPYAKEGEVLLRVTARAKTHGEAFALTEPAVKLILDEFGDLVYGVDVDSLEKLTVERLAQNGITLGTAESCTGGLLSKRITDISGASAVYNGGVCTYSNTAKISILGVDKNTLEKYGAVSRETACEMACGAARIFCSDIGIGITGIAGPDGGTAEKPVGTVFVALCRNGEASCRELHLDGMNRDLVRHISSSNALDMIRRSVDGRK